MNPSIQDRRSGGILTLIAAATLTLGCGVEEVDDVGQGTGRAATFMHGTPPGPAPWDYQLTSYNDHSTPACGGKKIDGGWYYATGAFTFGCGARLRLEANGTCVVVAVVDNGPADWVESKAASRCGGTGYIIDASPLVSRALFGSSSAGWSDCFWIQVTEVDASSSTGPVSCDANPWDPAPGFIGDPCVDDSVCGAGRCLAEADGFPEGSCTQPCTSVCPDQEGYAVTFCADVGGEGLCLSRCDYDLHPETGCRTGYQCLEAPRWNNAAVERPVCLPR